jgi:hypothetical protein
MYLTYGMGNQSCASWTDNPAATVAGDQWILGYWSALNLVNTTNKSVGSKTDGEGVLGEVRLYCQQHPSMLINAAVSDVYVRMAKVGG